MKLITSILLSLTFPVSAPALVLLSSNFDGNTGAQVLAGNVGETKGSKSVIVPWTQNSGITSISPVKPVLQTDNWDGGFVQLQNGSATLANENNLFVDRSLTAASSGTNFIGYSFDFVATVPFRLESVSIVAGFADSAGNPISPLSANLWFFLGGPVSITPLFSTALSSAAPYTTVSFDLAGTLIVPGTYHISVQTGGLPQPGNPPVYPIFDGITLNGSVLVPETSGALLSGIAGLALAGRRRRACLV